MAYLSLARVKMTIKHIHLVFERLDTVYNHVKRSKYTLFIESLEFLEHVVSSEGVVVCPQKNGTIKD